MTERLITCTHCRSKIPLGANVCSGCRTETDYGMPKVVLLLALLIPGGLAFSFVKHLHQQFDFGNTALWTIWGVLTAVGFGVLAWGMGHGQAVQKPHRVYTPEKQITRHEPSPIGALAHIKKPPLK